jgi:hypothetical protein
MSRVSGEKIKIKLFLCNKKVVWLRVCQILICTTHYYGCLFGSGGSVGNVVALCFGWEWLIYNGRIKLVVFEMNKNMALASYELPTEFYQ